MRHLEMQRLRCDIKDFDVAQVGVWVGGAGGRVGGQVGGRVG
jgi:hypothetical protein